MCKPGSPPKTADRSGSNQNAVNMEGFHVGHMNIILSGSTVIILLGVFLFLWYWKTGKASCCSSSTASPSPPTTSYLHPSPPLYFPPSAPPALLPPSHVVDMQTQQASAPSFQAPVISPSSPPSTTSLRDLEVSVAKLYAIVNTQAAATREMDTNNQN